MIFFFLINCRFAKRICLLKTISVAIHKRERHEVTCLGEILFKVYILVGEYFCGGWIEVLCFLPLNEPGSLQVVFCMWSTTI